MNQPSYPSTLIKYTAPAFMLWATWEVYQIAQAYPWQQALILTSIHYPLCIFGGCFALVRFNTAMRLLALLFAGLNFLLMGGMRYG